MFDRLPIAWPETGAPSGWHPALRPVGGGGIVAGAGLDPLRATEPENRLNTA